MLLPVEYRNSAGKKEDKQFKMTKMALLKHMAWAGMGMAPEPKKLRKFIGMFFHLNDFLQNDHLKNGRFSLPPDELYDPTEKAQFSNIAGKGIADFLAKRTHNTLFTVNYEAAMKLQGLPITGGRPDLIAFISEHEAFSIEAKGYTNGPRNMTNHLRQAVSRNIPLNFSAASVSYSLYDQLRCKFYENQSTPGTDVSELFRLLSKTYYSGLSKFLNKNLFTFKVDKIAGHRFFFVDLAGLYSDRNKNFPFRFLGGFLRFFNLQLILPYEICQWAKNGIPEDVKPFPSEEISSEPNILRYIDNDWIGLKIDNISKEAIIKLRFPFCDVPLVI